MQKYNIGKSTVPSIYYRLVRDYDISTLDFSYNTSNHIAPKDKKHKLTFCKHCDRYMHICWKCGNNTCNGGYGEINGEPCTECESAYEETSKFYKSLR